MTSHGLRVGLLWVLLLATLAIAASADFCEDLQKVVDSSRQGFAEVRGELVSDLVDPLSDRRVVWQCNSAFAGAKTCEVEWHRQAHAYNTFWHKQDEEANTATYEALVELLEGCGLSRKQTSRSGRSLWLISADNADLEIVLARNTRRVRLSFTVAGTLNP